MKTSSVTICLVLFSMSWTCVAIAQKSHDPSLVISTESLSQYQRDSTGIVSGSCFVVFKNGNSMTLRGQFIVAIPATYEIKTYLNRWLNRPDGIQFKSDRQKIETSIRQAIPDSLINTATTDVDGKFELKLPRGQWILWSVLDRRPGTIGAGLVCWAVQITVTDKPLKIDLSNANTWLIS